MTEKTVKQFGNEMLEAFGDGVEYMAVNNITGQTIKSDGYAPAPLPRLEIDGQDYIAIGHLNIKHAPPSEGVLAGMMRLATGRR